MIVVGIEIKNFRKEGATNHLHLRLHEVVIEVVQVVATKSQKNTKNHASHAIK